MIERKKKTCKCGCGEEGYIFGHGLIESCYRREYAKKQRAKQAAKNAGNLFKKKTVLPQTKRDKLDAMVNRAKKIKRVSDRNTYSDSEGNRYTQKEIDAKVRKAKQEFHDWFYNEHGYFFCEQCKEDMENGIEVQAGCERIDKSHIISEKEAKETGRVELCWDWKNNMRHLGRRHHQLHDKLY